jgi:hypothetical protein
MPPAMSAIAHRPVSPETIGIDPEQLRPNPFSLSLYGDPSAEIEREKIFSSTARGVCGESSRGSRRGGSPPKCKREALC